MDTNIWLERLLDQARSGEVGAFTDKELDLILNYDIKYRMGRDAEVDDE